MIVFYLKLSMSDSLEVKILWTKLFTGKSLVSHCNTPAYRKGKDFPEKKLSRPISESELRSSILNKNLFLKPQLQYKPSQQPSPMKPKPQRKYFRGNFIERLFRITCRSPLGDMLQKVLIWRNIWIVRVLNLRTLMNILVV